MCSLSCHACRAAPGSVIHTTGCSSLDLPVSIGGPGDEWLLGILCKEHTRESGWQIAFEQGWSWAPAKLDSWMAAHGIALGVQLRLSGSSDKCSLIV